MYIYTCVAVAVAAAAAATAAVATAAVFAWRYMSIPGRQHRRSAEAKAPMSAQQPG